jgi:hypothetical protein
MDGLVQHQGGVRWGRWDFDFVPMETRQEAERKRGEKVRRGIVWKSFPAGVLVGLLTFG